MDKNVKMAMLLDIYGKLLTAKQQDMLDLYYNQNLSLSEIAEEANITRQGVRKILVDGEKRLLNYEDLLGILDKKITNTKIIEELIKETKDLSFKDRLKKLL
ncbi:MAG: DNA-binding protein [Clostridia bacterium]|nr:DNA-binding protein [Clostridia bacterium]